MRIYFARHGESHANLLKEISNRGMRHGLTSKGRAQAQALAGGLDGQKITQIYSSPLLRAVETSAIVAKRLGVAYEISQALCEFDCGILEGRSDEQAWQIWQQLWEAWTIRHDWERRIEGGESLRDIQGRFEPFIDGLVKQ
jgi:broad specificity phosphatase PhoE